MAGKRSPPGAHAKQAVTSWLATLHRFNLRTQTGLSATVGQIASVMTSWRSDMYHPSAMRRA